MSACYVLDVMFVMLCEWANQVDFHNAAHGKESTALADLREHCGGTLDDVDEAEEDQGPTNLYLLKDWVDRVNKVGVKRG